MKALLTRSLNRARVTARPRSRLHELLPHGERLTTHHGWGELDQSPLRGSSLHDAFEQHDGRLVHKWRHYPDVYDEVLAPYRDGFTGPTTTGHKRPLRFLEIGVSEGGSLELWRTVFGPDAIIHGIDVDPSCEGLVDASIAQIHIGSQADPEFLRGVVDAMGGVDVVLDDGSHVAAHQKVTLETLWPLLSDGGIYLCEDVHTAYWRSFGGGLRRPGSIIEVAKDLVDDMHRWYYRVVGSASDPVPTRPDVWSVTFYDSVIALRKRSHDAPRRFTRGTTIRPDSDWHGAPG